MTSYVKRHIFRLYYRIKDLMKKNKSQSILYKRYGFSVGKFTYGYQQFFYEGVNLEKVGSFCSIAKNVTITGMNHPTKYVTTHPFIYYQSRGFIYKDRLDLIDDEKNQKVIIGNDVWIGTGVIILPSVKIGNGAIIGAGAVVTNDVPDYAIVVGVPAKIIKYRFCEKEINLLNKLEWWNWPNENIKENTEKFIDKSIFKLKE